MVRHRTSHPGLPTRDRDAPDLPGKIGRDRNRLPQPETTQPLFSRNLRDGGPAAKPSAAGSGRRWWQAAESHARGLGVEYMQVKTLGPSRPDKGYAGTRAFYAAMGFRPLEEFPQIWGEHNPCLILVKRLTV